MRRLTLTRAWPLCVLAASLALSVATGCNQKSKRVADDNASPARASASVKGASSAPASSARSPGRGETADPALIASLEKGYGGILDGNAFDFSSLEDPSESGGILSLAAGAHSSEEPDKFSAGWASQEAGFVLRQAMDGEYEHTTVNAHGHACLVFHEDRLVRRLVFTQDRTSHEYATSTQGRIILYYSQQQDEPRQKHLAMMHKGGEIKMHQVWEGSAPRRTEPAPEGLKGFIDGEARACFEAFGARNPTPGGAAPVAPPPPPAPPPDASATPPTFTIDRAEVENNGKVTLRFDRALSPPEGQRYWIAITRPSAKEGEYGIWHYVPAGASTDTVAIAGAGQWEIRLHDLYPKWKEGRIVARQTVTVKEAPQCALGKSYWGPCERTGCEPGYTCSDRENGGDGNCHCND